MNFLINNATLDYYMEKMGLKEKERAVWLERIRNDFNERIDNNELVKTILKMEKRVLQALTANSNFPKATQAVDEQRDFNIRLQLFALIIDEDYVNYQRFCRLKENEPKLMDRYSHCYIDNNNLIIMFEEFDE